MTYLAFWIVLFFFVGCNSQPYGYQVRFNYFEWGRVSTNVSSSYLETDPCPVSLTTVSVPSPLIGTILVAPARYTNICINLLYTVPDPSYPIGLRTVPYSCNYTCDSNNVYARCSNQDNTCTNITEVTTLYTNRCYYYVFDDHWNFDVPTESSNSTRICYTCEGTTVTVPTPTPTNLHNPIAPTTGQPTISGQPINGNPTAPITIPTIVSEYKKSESGRLSTVSWIERIILLFLINSLWYFMNSMQIFGANRWSKNPVKSFVYKKNDFLRAILDGN